MANSNKWNSGTKMYDPVNLPTRIKIVTFVVRNTSLKEQLTKTQLFVCRLFKIPKPEPKYITHAIIEVNNVLGIAPNCMFMDNTGNRWISTNVEKSFSGDMLLINMASITPIKVILIPPTELMYISSVYKE